MYIYIYIHIHIHMIKNNINSYTKCTPMPKVLLIPMVFRHHNFMLKKLSFIESIRIAPHEPILCQMIDMIPSNVFKHTRPFKTT